MTAASTTGTAVFQNNKTIYFSPRADKEENLMKNQSLKSLQAQFGVSAENKPTKSERVSLKQIQQQINYGNEAGISEAEENKSCFARESAKFAKINDILENILWSSITDYPALCDLHFRDLKFYGTIPKENASLLDLLVVEDWNARTPRELRDLQGDCISHWEYAPIKYLWKFFYNTEGRWFKELRKIKVYDLMQFLRQKNLHQRDIPDIQGENGNPITSEQTTLGWLLERMQYDFNGGWKLGEERIDKYEERMYRHCNTMQTIIHAICTGYCDVEARMKFFERYNGSTLCKLFAEERDYQEAVKVIRLVV